MATTHQKPTKGASRSPSPAMAGVMAKTLEKQAGETTDKPNREMKLNAMKSYRRSLFGEKHRGVLTAIGIRADESRRLSESAAEMKLIYPLLEQP